MRFGAYPLLVLHATADGQSTAGVLLDSTGGTSRQRGPSSDAPRASALMRTLGTFAPGIGQERSAAPAIGVDLGRLTYTSRSGPWRRGTSSAWRPSSSLQPWPAWPGI